MKVAGADGCRAGWFTVLLENGHWKVFIFPDIFTLWQECREASLILLDIPIGLREKHTKERLCDLQARILLGHERGMSIFPAPCRDAIYTKNYKEACKINKRMTGRKLTIQTWNIIPRIREVDILLKKLKSDRLIVRETHPEICFWALQGEHMKYSKKTEEGFLMRKELLQSVFPHTEEIIDYTLSTYPRKAVKRDDILDALAAVVTATGQMEKLATIPRTPEIDARGIPMEIVYRPFFKIKSL